MLSDDLDAITGIYANSNHGFPSGCRESSLDNAANLAGVVRADDISPITPFGTETGTNANAAKYHSSAGWFHGEDQGITRKKIKLCVTTSAAIR